MSNLYDIYCEHPQVSTDSRNVAGGSIFFALRGASFDGNMFAADALRSGAAFAVVDDRGVVPAGADGARYIVVEDVLASLQELALMHRERVGAQVVAITGTNGKTTTKELTTVILSRKYKVHSTSGNLNNHIGVPLTLLSMPAGTEVAVIEMGASAVGEIAALCEMAAPRYGLITNVGIAHLEGFGGVEGVKKAKGELYDYLARHGGTAFVNGADEILLSMAAERQNADRQSALTESSGLAAGNRGLETIIYDTASARLMKNNLAGGYNIYNIAAAAAIGRRFGVPDHDIAAAVAHYMPGGNRSCRVETGRNVIIADCYNANPSSMTAALENFAAEQAPIIALPENRACPKPAEKMIVLGDMLELGGWSAMQHDDILKAALTGGFRQIFLVGENFREACRRVLNGAAPAAGIETPEKQLSGSVDRIRYGDTEISSFRNTGSLLDYLEGNDISGFFILLKGSRGIALEKSISFL